MICEYGCKKEAQYILKNGKYCCSEKFNSCIAIIEKNRNSNTGLKRSNKVKEKLKFRKRGLGMSGKYHSEETKKRYSETRKGKGNGMYAKHHSRETKEKIRIKSQRFVGERNPMYGKKQSDEAKIKIGIKSKEKFLKDDVISKYRYSRKINKLEEFLLTIFNKNDLDINYVGNYSLWIGNANPDFIKRESNKAIELFGDFWHGEEYRKRNYDFLSNKEHEQNRINYFKERGYECLVIWENELKNIDLVINKVRNFLGK